ncbi:MAG: DNA-directed RNA polymerase subunit omega [Clostridiales bacterium]|nr:DNA-directed RNA polymerase subunit omega [Clostridiales bacterium]
MLNIDMRTVLKGHLSRYSLVTGVAKRAREIALDAEERGEIIIEKPVTLALEELKQGKYEIEEPEEIRNL